MIEWIDLSALLNGKEKRLELNIDPLSDAEIVALEPEDERLKQVHQLSFQGAFLFREQSLSLEGELRFIYEGLCDRCQRDLSREIKSSLVIYVDHPSLYVPERHPTGEATLAYELEHRQFNVPLWLHEMTAFAQPQPFVCESFCLDTKEDRSEKGNGLSGHDAPPPSKDSPFAALAELDWED